MIDRIFITLALAFIALIGYRAFIYWNRKRADSAMDVTARPFQGQPYILYFRSDTCTSCATQTQLFEQDATILDRVHKIDVDKKPDVAQKYGVMTVPTLMVMDEEGVTQYIHYGVVHPRKLKQQLPISR